MPAVATTGSNCDLIEASLRSSLEAGGGGASASSFSLEEKLASSAKKVLLTKIDYCPAVKEYSTTTLKNLQTKYICLNSVSENNDVATSRKEENHVTSVTSVANGTSREDHVVPPWSEGSSDGIPMPRVVIHPSDNVKLGWLRVYKIGAGLANLGNTCFLNATLQCLTYTPPLVNHLIEFNEHSTSCKNVGFCMMCELQRHIRRALEKNGEIIRPQCILQKLRSIAAHMSWGRQEDAHEFLRYVMESMISSSLNGYSNAKLDRVSFETTVVNQIFGGYHRSQVSCLRCKERSDTYDHFMDLMLDIKNVPSLEKAMENFVQPEVLDSENAYMCPNCKQKCPAKKRFTIHRAPNIATFQLKRFDYSRSLGGKITKHIAFPEKFDMRSCMSQKQGPPIMYLLYAVLVHQGPSCNSGHYFCFVRNSNNLWYLMDDSKVRQVSLNIVLGQQAYLLFYTRIPNNGQLLKSPLQMSTSNNRVPFAHHSSNSNSVVNGSAGNPVNEPFGLPLIRKPNMLAPNLLKPKSGLTSTAMSTATAKSTLAGTTSSLPNNRDKVTFDFKLSSGGSGTNGSGVVNHQVQITNSRSPSSSFSASNNCAANDNNQQKHPRIVMQIKNGKVYNYQHGWGPLGSRAPLSAADNNTSSLTCSGSSLVPYTPDSSEESDQDNSRLNSPRAAGGGILSSISPKRLDSRVGKGKILFPGESGPTHLTSKPKGFDAGKCIPKDVPCTANDSNTNADVGGAVFTGFQSVSVKKEDRLVNGISNKKHVSNSADSQLSVVVSQNCIGAKINATSPWMVVDSSQQSPSVASEGSNNSVNSTTGWTVIDQEKENGNSKTDRIYGRWMVFPAADVPNGDGHNGVALTMNGVKKLSSPLESADEDDSRNLSNFDTSKKCKTVRSEREGDSTARSSSCDLESGHNKSRSRAGLNKHVTGDCMCCSTDVAKNCLCRTLVSPNADESDAKSRLSSSEDLDSPAQRSANFHSSSTRDRTSVEDVDDVHSNGKSVGGTCSPLVNGHGSHSSDGQATKRHKKRKKNKRDRDGSSEDSRSKKKAKYSDDVNSLEKGDDDEVPSLSKKKRHRSSGSSGGESNSSCGYELEWVEKTKETLEEEEGNKAVERLVTCATESKETDVKDTVKQKQQGYPPTLSNGDIYSKTCGQEVVDNGSATLTELLKNGSRGYGTGVSTWDGQRSLVDRDAEADTHMERFGHYEDDYDEEYDRGRMKKVKQLSMRSHHNFGASQFQRVHDMKTAGNNVKREPYRWHPPSYTPYQWGDPRRGSRRNNHNYYHHNGNRSRQFYHNKQH